MTLIPTASAKLDIFDSFTHEVKALSCDQVSYYPRSVYRVSPRQFRLTDGTVFLAFLLGEISDSFLVFFPMRVQSLEGKGIAMASLDDSPIVRVFKACIASSLIPTSMDLYALLRAAETAYQKYPEFFTEHIQTQVTSLMTALMKDPEVQKRVPKDREVVKGDSITGAQGMLEMIKSAMVEMSEGDDQALDVLPYRRISKTRH